MQDDLLPPIKVERVIATPPLFDESEDRDYWLARTPQERWQHVEFLRRINYGHLATARMQKVLAVTTCDWK